MKRRVYILSIILFFWLFFESSLVAISAYGKDGGVDSDFSEMVGVETRVNDALTPPGCILDHMNGKHQGFSGSEVSKSGFKGYGFSDLYNEMSKDSCDRGDKRTKRLRQGALRVMEEALAYYQCRRPRAIQYSEPDMSKYEGWRLKSERAKQRKHFYLKMKQMWSELAHEIVKADESIPADKKGEEIQKYSYPHQSFYSHSADGVIFLPTFKDESNFTKLKRYYPLGIFPIRVRKQAIKDLRRITSHPFNPDISTGIYHYMLHDRGHSFIMDESFMTLRLEEPKNCEQFKVCLDLLSKQNEQKSSLYDILHEFGFRKSAFLRSKPGSLDRIPFSNVLETAFEAVLDEDEEKFSFDSLLGEGTDKNNVCASLDRPQLLENKEILNIIFDLFPKKYQQLMNDQRIDDRMPKPIQLFGVTFDGNKAHLPLLVEGFLLRLKNICAADFPNERPTSTDKNDETLKRKFHSAMKAGFAAAVERELGKKLAAIRSIQEEMEKQEKLEDGPKCKQFFYHK